METQPEAIIHRCVSSISFISRAGKKRYSPSVTSGPIVPVLFPMETPVKTVDLQSLRTVILWTLGHLSSCTVLYFI